MKHSVSDESNVRGDIFGGITAAIVALPLALAFGVQSGLGASAGLYGAIVLGIIAAALGGTPTQISGPTGPMTVVSASVVALAIEQTGSLEAALAIILMTFFLAGIFQILMGVMKIGKYIKYLPYPVLSGFMSGIGVIIILLQVYPLLGHSSPGKIINIVLHISHPLSDINWYCLGLGTATIAIIYLSPLITKKIPGTLIALIVVSGGTYFTGSDITCIGDIPEGLPKLQVNTFLSFKLSQFSLVLFPALTLSGLGAIDTLLTSVVADNITKTKHRSNKELIGQGLGNMAAAVFGGIPGAGATMRTVVNVNSGGRTRISGIIHGIVLFFILIGIGKLVAHIPLAVLAGILITVGVGIIDRKGLHDLAAMPRADAAVMIIVLVLTIFVDLLQAVGIGMVIASVLFMKRMSDLVEQETEIEQINPADKELRWSDEKDIPEDILRRIYIQRFDGPLFFGALSKFHLTTRNLPSHVELVIIRMKKVPYIDLSGLYALETVIREMLARDITVVMTMIQKQPLYMLKRVKVIPGLIPEDKVFDNFSDFASGLKGFLEKTRREKDSNRTEAD
jgi:SulP family sulfate permease